MNHVARLMFWASIAGLNVAASCDATLPTDPVPASAPAVPQRSAVSLPPQVQDEETDPATAKQDADVALVRLTLEITDNGVVVLSKVDAPGALNRRDPHRNAATFFRVVSDDNRVLFERGFEIPGERRAEFADENGKLSRVQGPAEPKVISIVVPVSNEAVRVRLLRHGAGAGGGGQNAGTDPPEDTLIGEVTL